ncbi:hypothetical protein ACER0C_016088 [Sarotherodon galilaeus]
MSGWREVWSLHTPPFSAACWSGGAGRRSWPSDWGLECGASLLLRSRGGLLPPTAGKRVTPPGSGCSFPLQGQGYLDPGSGIRRHLSGDISGPPRYGGLSPPHHSPCQWQTPSDIGALVVLCVRGWASRYAPAHSLAAAYRGLEPGARSGHFGGGVPSASRPGARSLRHSWLPAELTGTSLQPPLASAPRLLSDPSSGTLLSSFWDSGAAAPLLVFLGLLCSGGLWMSGVGSPYLLHALEDGAVAPHTL